MLRTHTCWELTAKNSWEQVILSWWVNKLRNLWWMIFVDLRDRYWITQVVFNPDNKELFSKIENVKLEYVIQIKWKVNSRPSDQINKDMITWEVEIKPIDVKILSKY